MSGTRKCPHTGRPNRRNDQAEQGRSGHCCRTPYTAPTPAVLVPTACRDLTGKYLSAFGRPTTVTESDWRYCKCGNDGFCYTWPSQRNHRPPNSRRNIVLLHVMPERPVGHAQQFGRLDLHPTCAAEGFFEEAFLKIFDVELEVKAFVRKVGIRSHPGIGRYILGQMLGRQFVGSR